MADSIDINVLRESLQRAMLRRGIKAKPLSIAAGLGETAVRDILKKPDARDVKLGTLTRLADVLDTSVSDLVGGAGVPVLGRIGAGGSIVYDESEEPEYVPAPPMAGGRLMALEVSGDSMLPKYEPGDIIYVRRDHEGILPTYLGEYCAVGLADGGVFLKLLAAGTAPNRYTLRSLNAADMVNVEVQWASPVLFIMPKRSREKVTIN